MDLRSEAMLEKERRVSIKVVLVSQVTTDAIQRSHMRRRMYAQEHECDDEPRKQVYPEGTVEFRASGGVGREDARARDEDRGVGEPEGPIGRECWRR